MTKQEAKNVLGPKLYFSLKILIINIINETNTLRSELGLQPKSLNDVLDKFANDLANELGDDWITRSF